MTVDLRPMRWWDIARVTELEHSLFGADAWPATMFWSELAERRTRHYLVAIAPDDGAVVGYAGLCAYTPEESYVQTIAVADGHRREGIGSTLLRALLDEALRRESRHVDLEVRADNPAAIALYEGFGFVRIGARRGYYQPSGADAVVMRRVLHR